MAEGDIKVLQEDGGNYNEIALKVSAIEIGSGGGGTDPIIRYYTAGATWTKPAGLSHVIVVCIGGGGGGASGARRAADTLTLGGGGGALPLPMRRTLTAAQLDTTETITVGAGGAGGAAQGTDDSANVAGADGGDTSFGSLVLSQGALAGQNNGNGGTANSITSQTPPQEACSIHRSSYYNGVSSHFSGSSPTDSQVNFMRLIAATTGIGGAPGGGIDTSNTQIAGGAGGRAYNAANTQSAAKAAGTAGGGNGADGHDNYCDQLLLSFGGFVTTHGYGTAGAGGGSANAAAGGKGGNGGNYGAGGGGGGASRNGYASGAGGNGGDGLCIVMEFYGA
jgi:hypothetical protein